MIRKPYQIEKLETVDEVNMMCVQVHGRAQHGAGPRLPEQPVAGRQGRQEGPGHHPHQSVPGAYTASPLLLCLFCAPSVLLRCLFCADCVLIPSLFRA
jgi:hypothetical protein